MGSSVKDESTSRAGSRAGSMGPAALPEVLEQLSWLRALARRLVRDPLDAEDVVQDTLVVALARGPRAGVSLRSWLGAVLRNAVRQERRASRRRARREALRAAEAAASVPSSLDVLAELSLHRRLLELVHELEEPYREALYLRYLRGRSPRRIAAELGLPVKTVHTRLERGLARLRERLDRACGGDRSAWLAALLPLARETGAFPTAGGAADLPIPLAPLAWMLPMQAKPLLLGLVVLGAAVLAPVVLRTAVRPGPTAAGSVEQAGKEPPALPAPAPAPPAAPLAEKERRPVAGEPDRPAAVAPDPVVALLGWVRDVEGRGVPGLDVHLEHAREGGFRRADDPPRARSGPDGAFSLAIAGEGGRLSVDSPEWASVVRPLVEAGDARPERGEPLLVVVAPRRAYSGHVVDPAGAPVAGARVEATLAGSFLQRLVVAGRTVHLLLPLAETVSGAGGAFALDAVGLVAGARLRAVREGLGSVEVELPERSSEGLVLRLAPPASGPGTVHGLVLDGSGVGVADVQVSAGADSVVTDGAGCFALPLAPWQEDVVVRAAVRGRLPASAPFARGAPDGADPLHPLVLVLGDEAPSLRGRVVDAEGEPVAGARVWTPDTTWLGSTVHVIGGATILGPTTVEALVGGRSGPWSDHVEATTDERGAFELTGLCAREYALFAAAPGTLAGAGPLFAHPDAEGVTLRLERAVGRRVAGRVLSRGGIALAGVRVVPGRSFAWTRPERVDDPWAGSFLAPPGTAKRFEERAVVTDPDGRFALEGLSAEQAFLSLDGAPILQTHSVRLDPADELSALEIVVDARATFEVVLASAPGEADGFELRDAAGEFLPVFAQVDGHLISTHGTLAEGRSGPLQSSEGERVIVLLRAGVETRRVPVRLVPGVQEVRL